MKQVIGMPLVGNPRINDPIFHSEPLTPIRYVYDQKIPHIQHGDSIGGSHRSHYIWLASLGKSGETIFIATMEHTINGFLGYNASLPRSAH